MGVRLAKQSIWSKKLVELGYITKIQKAPDGKNSHACNLNIVHRIPSSAVDSKDVVMSNAETLPDVTVAFPRQPELSAAMGDISEEISPPHAEYAHPDAQNSLPHAQNAFKQYPLNYIQLTHNQSVSQSIFAKPIDRQTDEEFEDVLWKIDEHFGYEHFKRDICLHDGYRAVSQYMAEMLVDDYTKIGSQKLSKDMLAKIIFDANSLALQDFVRDIPDMIKDPYKIKNWNGYLKTCIIEYFRERLITEPIMRRDNEIWEEL